MRHATVAAALIAIVGIGSAAQAQEKDVTLQGCVLKGKNGGYIITDVITSRPENIAGSREVVGTAGSNSTGQVVYWLDDSRKLKKFVGHRVMIMGELEGDLKPGEVAVERNDDGLVELDVKYKGRKVTAEMQQAPEVVLAALPTVVPGGGPVGTSGTVGTAGAAAMIQDKEIGIDYLIRKVDVKTVHAIDGTCR